LRCHLKEKGRDVFAGMLTIFIALCLDDLQDDADYVTAADVIW